MLTSALFRRPKSIYRGLLTGCPPGVHEVIVSAVQSQVPHRQDILDLGAGSGALLVRMADHGFSRLHAADLGGEGLVQKGIAHTRVDLDGAFASAFGRKFKVVISTEVIEHIESPRNFLKQARELLDDDGYLLVSTPNIAFWEGRLKFLFTGQLWGFGEHNYRLIRHISPLTWDQLRLMMQEIGLEVVWFRTAGSFATLARWIVLAPLWFPMRLLFGRFVLGECLLVVARKSEPNSELLTAKVEAPQVFWR